jgi:hypothetical protein
MGAAAAVATAVTFVWLGMVLAISFLEAPLKFRAPGVTVPLGLGIGRLVFRALNAVEAVLALALAVCLVVGDPGAAVWPAVAAVAVLLVQVLAVRPGLSRRSDAVLAGEDVPRSHAHYGYVGLEVVKVAALVTAGVLLLAG